MAQNFKYNLQSREFLIFGSFQPRLVDFQHTSLLLLLQPEDIISQPGLVHSLFMSFTHIHMKQQGDLGVLVQLQHLLRQEAVLKDSESVQKNRFRQMIEQQVERSLAADLHSKGSLIRDDSFGDCYNFIKQAILTISKEPSFTLALLDISAGDPHMEKLVPMIVNVLYQNMVESDESFKDVNEILGRIVIENVDLNRQRHLNKMAKNNFLKRKIIEQYFRRHECTVYGKNVSRNIMITIVEDSAKYSVPSLIKTGKSNLLTSYEEILFDYDRKTNKNTEGLPSHEVLSKIQQESSKLTRQSERKLSEVSGASSVEESNEAFLAGLVQTYLEDIMNSVHCMPQGLRLLCKRIERHLSDQKVPRQSILEQVWKFLFTLYLEQLYFPERYLKSNHSSEQKMTILDKVRSVFSQLAQLSNQPLRKSLSKFTQEVLALPSTMPIQNRLKIHAVVISYQDMKILFESILRHPELKDVNSRVYNRVLRVRQMSEDFDFFRKASRPLNECYVLFQELVLPATLQIDYAKQYNQVYKDDKYKSILRQILVSCDPIQGILASARPKDFNDLLAQIDRQISREQVTTSDAIPLKVKLKYLMWLSPAKHLPTQMIKQAEIRLKESMQLYKNTKIEYLRALQSLKYYSERSKEQQQIIKTRKLKEQARHFLSQLRMGYCVSSPKSRELQFGTSNKFIFQNHDKIIIEPTQTCIHHQGIPHKQAGTLHASTVSEFLDCFCSLEEVRTAIATGIDGVGINTNIFWFLSSIQQKSIEHPILSQHQTFFKEYLENVLTRRIANLIMPRHPTYQDAAIYTKTKTLEWILPSHLKIGPKNRIEQIWDFSTKCLRDLEKASCVSQKFQCIKQLMRVLSGVLMVNEEVSPDKIYPMITYALIRTRPKRLQSSLKQLCIILQSEQCINNLLVLFNCTLSRARCYQVRATVSQLSNQPCSSWRTSIRNIWKGSVVKSCKGESMRRNCRSGSPCCGDPSPRKSMAVWRTCAGSSLDGCTRINLHIYILQGFMAILLSLAYWLESRRSHGRRQFQSVLKFPSLIFIRTFFIIPSGLGQSIISSNPTTNQQLYPKTNTMDANTSGYELDSKVSKREGHIIVNQQFLIKSFIRRSQNYNIYEGSDLKAKEPVVIYVKAHKIGDTTRIRRDLHSKLQSICPKWIWAGEERINNVFYHVEVFQKLGPSLKQILRMINFEVPAFTAYMLIYNILRLLQKLADNSLVYRQLRFSKIHLSRAPESTELFFIDFQEVRKVSEPAPRSDSKYCSVGTHLGLNANLKDDLESLCYMIFDMFTCRNFSNHAPNIKKKGEHYLTKKSDLKPEQLRQIPEDCIEFYNYVRNLSADQQPNYEYWKKQFKRNFFVEQLKKPYVWTLKMVMPVNKAEEQDLESINYDVYDNEETFENEETIREKVVKSLWEAKFLYEKEEIQQS